MQTARFIVLIAILISVAACDSIRGYTRNDWGYITPNNPNYKLKGQFQDSLCNYDFPLVYVYEQDSAWWQRNGLEVPSYLNVLMFFRGGQSFFGTISDSTMSSCSNLKLYLNKVNEQYFICAEENKLTVEYYAYNASIRGYYIQDNYYLSERFLYNSPSRYYRSDSLIERVKELMDKCPQLLE